eukprot:GDKJ01059037.1.p1 GENE.GDKJ01059037.1~~GDKJ01059037.1.p1  ORF type:complete len:285 (+),score=69.90 GDKJ01059037.1:80-934(+)
MANYDTADCGHDHQVTVTLPTGTVVSPKRRTLKSNDEFARTHSPSGRPGHCVDELCTCSKHACKPQWKPNPAPFMGNTTYGQDFEAKPIERREAMRPVHTYQPTKFEGQTTNQHDYKGYTADRSPSCKPQHNVARNIPFEGKSSYATEFDKKDMPPVYQRERAQYRPNNAPLESLTSNKAAYVAHAIPERVNFSPSRAPPKNIPFNGTTNYADNYTAHPMPEKFVNQRSQYKNIPDDRQFDSTYTSSFVKPNVPKCPVHELPAAPAPSNGREHVFWDEQKQQWY